MGKTNPTFRDQIRGFENEYESMRRGLRLEDQEHYDRLLEHANQFADAAGYANPVSPEIAILLSICLGQQREITELREKLEE